MKRAAVTGRDALTFIGERNRRLQYESEKSRVSTPDSISSRGVPLRARLHWYRLSSSEFLVLTAMCEHCSDGSTIWASISRLAAYSKLSERTVQRVIRGLVRRGILSQLAPGNAAKRRPATYRVNEAALTDDPAMGPYRSRQKQLPGIQRVPVPGEPIADDFDRLDLVQPCHQSGAESVGDLVQPCHQSGAALSPDSRFDSRTDSKALGIQQPPPRYMQSDFDERDFRKLQAALAEIYLPLQGARIVEQDSAPAGAYARPQLFREACRRAGITKERGYRLVEGQIA